MFVDADDFWCENIVLKRFSDLIKVNPDADIIESVSHTDIYDTTQPICTIPFDNKADVFTGENFYLAGYFEGYLWRSAYRRIFLKNFKFRENVFFEDGDFRLKTILGASKIVKIDYPFYAYVNNEDSTIRSKKEEVFFANVDCNKIIFNSIIIHPNEKIKQAALRRLKSNVFSWLKISKDYPIPISRKVFNYARQVKMLEITQFPLSIREKIVMSAMKNIPLLVVAAIKCGVLTRRYIRKIFNYHPR